MRQAPGARSSFSTCDEPGVFLTDLHHRRWSLTGSRRRSIIYIRRSQHVGAIREVISITCSSSIAKDTFLVSLSFSLPFSILKDSNDHFSPTTVTFLTRARAHTQQTRNAYRSTFSMPLQWPFENSKAACSEFSAFISINSTWKVQ